LSFFLAPRYRRLLFSLQFLVLFDILGSLSGTTQVELLGHYQQPAFLCTSCGAPLFRDSRAFPPSFAAPPFLVLFHQQQAFMKVLPLHKVLNPCVRSGLNDSLHLFCCLGPYASVSPSGSFSFQYFGRPSTFFPWPASCPPSLLRFIWAFLFFHRSLRVFSPSGSFPFLGVSA